MTGTQPQLAGNVSNSNERIEKENRKIFDAHGVFAINLMGSPGSGRTQLILRTVQGLSREIRIGVVEGSSTSDRLDSEQVLESGVPVTDVNTGGTGSVDATMLSRAIVKLPLRELDLVLVENVGGLILPAFPRLGTHANVVVASVPEGDEKPYRYPGIYSWADVVILNKTDLLQFVPFDLSVFRRGVQRVNPAAPVFPLSAYTGGDVHRWFDWLLEQCAVPKKPAVLSQTS